MANYGKSMHDVQKRYVPANLFIALIAFVAAFCMIFTPWLDASVNINGDKLIPVLEKMLITDEEANDNVSTVSYMESNSSESEGGFKLDMSSLDMKALIRAAVEGLDLTVSIKVEPTKLLAAATGTKEELAVFVNSVIADGDIAGTVDEIINNSAPTLITNVFSTTVKELLKSLQQSQQEAAAANPDQEIFVLTDAQLESVSEYILGYEEDLNAIFKSLSENKADQAKAQFTALVEDFVMEVPDKLREDFPDEFGEELEGVTDEQLQEIVDAIPQKYLNQVFEIIVDNAHDAEGNFSWLNLLANIEQMQEDFENADWSLDEEENGDVVTQQVICPMSVVHYAEDEAAGGSTGSQELDNVISILRDPGTYLTNLMLESFTLEEIQTVCMGVWVALVGIPAAFWALLGVCALLRLFMQKKRVQTWYVKLFCVWSGLLLLLVNLALAYAPAMLAAAGVEAGMLALLEAVAVTISGSGLIAGICWIVLVLVGWFWYNPIKREERMYR